MQRRAAGFTLLEMIVVLVIAALIIGIGASAVAQLTEEHVLRKVAHDAEGVFMQAMTRALATTQPQSVNLEELGTQAKLTVRRMGADEFTPVAGQRLLLRPGGLCEPLTLRWQKDAAWISATLDPLTGGFTETEENL
jgi:prepilin-type N-terminal cleavage/methylation domain-containing protein